MPQAKNSINSEDNLNAETLVRREGIVETFDLCDLGASAANDITLRAVGMG
jgi:hypothetical protein